MLYEDRATGKTFRKILNSLEKASLGLTVAYVSRTGPTAEYYFAKAVSVVRAFDTSQMIVRVPRDRQIKFPNGGSVRFLSDAQFEGWARGRRDYLTQYDH